jgi:hypothetical protein
LKPGTPLLGHEFERSKLLSATLPLVTRIFLLAQDGCMRGENGELKPSGGDIAGLLARYAGMGAMEACCEQPNGSLRADLEASLARAAAESFDSRASSFYSQYFLRILEIHSRLERRELKNICRQVVEGYGHAIVVTG